jgi:hypothetical protein
MGLLAGSFGPPRNLVEWEMRVAESTLTGHMAKFYRLPVGRLARTADGPRPSDRPTYLIIE